MTLCCRVALPVLKKRSFWIPVFLLGNLLNIQQAEAQTLRGTYSGPVKIDPIVMRQKGRLVTLTAQKISIEAAILEIQRQSGLSIAYGAEYVPLKRETKLDVKNVSAQNALQAVLLGTNITVRTGRDGNIALVPGEKQEPPRQDSAVQTVGTISGRVIDSATKQGIEGATVTIEGTKLADVTRQNGTFSLSKVPVGNRLVTVRRSGYELRKVSATVDGGKPTTVMVTMRPSMNVLSQVVTTAAGKQYRAEVGNDIARIDVDSLMQTAPVRSVTDLLYLARVPGVEVTPTSGNPGAPSRIRLRGPGSISQSNDPLVVVDGVRLNAILDRENTTIYNGINPLKVNGGGELSGRLVSSHLDDIDPASIETIEVLRGPSAASLYGTDAANGVIVITTKRGRAGPSRWTVSLARDWDKLSGEYQPIYKGWGHSTQNDLATACNIRNTLLSVCVQDSVSLVNSLNAKLLTPDAEGRTENASASVQGGTSAFSYFLSTTLQNMQGATQIPIIDQVRIRKLGESVSENNIRPERYRRTAVTTRVTTQPARDLDLSLSVSATQTQQRTGNALLGFALDAAAVDPLDTLTFALGSVLYTQDQGVSDNTTGRAAVTADWRRWPWVKPSVTAGADRSYRTDDAITRFRDCTMGPGCAVPRVQRGILRQEQSAYTVSFRTPLPISLGNLERFLTLQPSVGGNIDRRSTSGSRVFGDSLNLGSEDVATAAARLIDATGSASATAGYYFNMTVGLLQRFYTQLGFRRDIGSALSTRMNAPTYPKLTASWLLSDEPYFPTSALLKTLKLRVAYGHSAVQPKFTDIEGTYLTRWALVNGRTLNTVSLDKLGNYLLRPERSVESELGFDAGLLDNRIDLSFTVATKRNRDELIGRPVAPSTGFQGTRFENIARVLNRSVEITANNRLIDRAGVTWTADVSFSTQLNRIEALGDGVTPGANAARLVEGYPVQSVWSKQMLKFNDVNQDGVLTEQEVVIGDSVAYMGWGYPRYKLAYSTAVALFNRRLRLSASFAQDVGLTQNMSVYDGRGIEDINAPIEEQAYALLAGTSYTQFGYRQTVTSLRWNSASASLEIPARWSRVLRASSGTVSLQGSHLGLWTNYRGRDPAVNGNPLGESLTDNGATVPAPRKFSVSLQLRY